MPKAAPEAVTVRGVVPVAPRAAAVTVTDPLDKPVAVVVHTPLALVVPEVCSEGHTSRACLGQINGRSRNRIVSRVLHGDGQDR